MYSFDQFEEPLFYSVHLKHKDAILNHGDVVAVAVAYYLTCLVYKSAKAPNNDSLFVIVLVLLFFGLTTLFRLTEPKKHAI